MPAKKDAALPCKIIPFQNGDKTAEETWASPIKNRARDIGNFPNPSRVLLIGPPGGGKSTLVKNLVIHQRPRFDEVYLIHEDAGATRDYEDLEPTAEMSDVPDLDFWSELPEKDDRGRVIKRAVICDDLELTHAHKERKRNLGILFRYASSHKNLTVYFCHQSFFDLPSLIKKMSNVFIVWKPRARNEVSLIENRVGLKKGDLSLLFAQVATGSRDSICIDHTLGTPAPLRLNVWEPLVIED